MTNNEKTIYISIPSLDDLELEHTITSAFENAKSPSRVYIGVGLLSMYRYTLTRLKKMSKRYPNVSFSYQKQKKNNVRTLGVGRGRRSAELLYRNQDFFLQVDAHTHFEKNWDTFMIEMFEEAVQEVGDDKLVITCIPPVFGYDSNEKPYRTGPDTRYPVFVNDGFFVGVVPQWKSEDSLEVTQKRLIPSPKANSAMIFGNKKFAQNTGISEDAIFYDEEIIYSINLVGDGFALVFPNTKEFPISHLDGDLVISGHERSFFLDYLDGRSFEKMHDILQENYLKFVKDPINALKIEKYKKYSKVDALRGRIHSIPFYIPESYR